MRVLIIGSSGSIGKHLTSFLNSSKKIKEVYAIDKKKDKQISKKVKFKKLDLEYLKSDTKFSKKIDCAIILGAIVNFKNLDPLEFHYKNIIILSNFSYI